MFEVIIYFLMGAMFGNLSTTFIYRIPRNIPINGLQQKPMCGNCKTIIKYPYYAPFVHVLVKGFKCRHCGVKIPFIYTLIELFFALFSVAFFSYFSFNELSITKFLIFLVLSICFVLNFLHQNFYEKSNWMLAILTICFAHFTSQTNDLLFYLVTKLMFAVITICLLAIFYKLKKQNLEILETCFILITAILLSPIMFYVASFLFIILKIINKKLQILPFLILFLF